jgi:hypothetical protein
MLDTAAIVGVSARARDSAREEDDASVGLGQLGLVPGHCALRPSAQCPVFISLLLLFFFFYPFLCLKKIRPPVHFCKVWNLVQIMQGNIVFHQKVVWTVLDFFLN